MHGVGFCGILLPALVRLLPNGLVASYLGVKQPFRPLTSPSTGLFLTPSPLRYCWQPPPIPDFFFAACFRPRCPFTVKPTSWQPSRHDLPSSPPSTVVFFPTALFANHAAQLPAQLDTWASRTLRTSSCSAGPDSR